MLPLSLLAVPGLIITNGLFVSAEFSLVSIRRSRLDELEREGRGSAPAVRKALNDLDTYIAGSQLGVSISSLALGWVGTPAVALLLSRVFEQFNLAPSQLVLQFASALLAFLLVCFLHVLFAEMLPKTVALQAPEQVALLVIKPFNLAMALIRPFVYAMTDTGNLILRIFNLEPSVGHQEVHSAEEIQILVRRSHQAGMLDDAERQIIQRTFRFSELTVGEIMTPRLDVFALDLSKPADEILDEVAHTQHTRLPVHEGDPDVLLGLVHVQSILKMLVEKNDLSSLRELVQPALVVPENSHVGNLLEEFQTRRTQMALVVDEYGSITGLVTLQDIIEEVFGEMQESQTPGQSKISEMPDGSLLIKGDVRLDEVWERCGWDLRDPDVDTIAGYIMKQIGRVAKIDDEIEIEKGLIRVTAMVKRRITQVKLTPRSGQISSTEDA